MLFATCGGGEMSAPDVEITVDDSQVRELCQRMGESNMLKVMSRGVQRGLNTVHEKLPEYPSPRVFTQMTRKQASSRHLWSRGAVKVAGVRGRYWVSTYRRTGTLGKSITTKVQTQGDSVIGRIGTNVSRQTASSGYAEYVIGMPDEQAWMHQGRWWSLGQEVEKNSDDVSNAVGDEIGAELEK